MNINTIFEIEKKLSQEELDMLDKDELTFLKNKIKKEVNKSLEILFVPQTFYELFLLSRYLYTENENSYLTKNGKFYKDYESLKLFKNLANAAWTSPENFNVLQNTLNQRKNLQNEYFAINNVLFKFIKKQIDLEKCNKQTWISFANKFPFHSRTLVNLRNKGLKKANLYFKKNSKPLQYSDFDLWSSNKLMRMFLVWSWFSSKEKTKLKLFQKVIAAEYDAFINGKFMLYRGTNLLKWYGNSKSLYLLDSRIELKHNEWHDLSFGITLFSGFFADFGANPYSFFLQAKVGYGLTIDKKSFRKNLNKKMFYMPTLNSLSALTGFAEDFHARTISYIPPIDAHYENHRFFKHKLFESQKFLLEKELEWSHFLRKNFKILHSNKKKITEEKLKNNHKKYEAFIQKRLKELSDKDLISNIAVPEAMKTP
jgi:hypothetical protein